MKDQEPTIPSGNNSGSSADARTTDGQPPHGSGDPSLQADGPIQVSGDKIGLYRLMRIIGEGGMGEVWLAEQEEPIRRRVAVKIIKQGMDTRQVVSRFESERQVLAVLDHPNIAKVLDAGTTRWGKPYFVMEYVQGEIITDYCDKHQLTTQQRLELFFQVCQGIQHAHRNGIIHRDIKPGNVLVTFQNSQPIPKIIDFGVAKATDMRVAERSMFTEVGQLVGTPEYMSPEQAEMTGLGIDTRTDIYSLGVLLYVLLVGVLPFDLKDLRKAGYDEIRRRIREDEPARPSNRLSTLGGDLPSLAKARGTNPTKLTQELRGDLDWIVMKAMDKDRTRRYETPTELSADLQRHLLNEPVIASPPSTLYRVRKFVRRHTVGVSFAAVVAVLLTTLGVSMVIQAGRIARQRDRANEQATLAAKEAETSQQVAGFLVSLFEVSDPGRARGETITAREILDKGANRIQDELSDQPTVQATMLKTIGRVYTELGLYQEARPLLDRALELDEGNSDELTVAGTLLDLSQLFSWQGDYQAAEKAARRAIALYEKQIEPGALEVASCFNALGNALHNQGKLDEALVAHLRSLALRETVPDASPAVAASLHNIAIVYFFQEAYPKAEEYYLRSAELELEFSGPDSPDYATTLHTLAIVYQEMEQLDKALELERRATAIREKALGPDHLHLAFSLCTLGNIHRLSGTSAEAETLQRRALAIGEASVGEAHGETIWMRESLALTLAELGQYREGEELLRVSIAFLREQGDQEWLKQDLEYLAANLRLQGRGDEAAAVDAEVVALATP